MLSWQSWSVQQCLWHVPGLLDISLWKVKFPLWKNQTTQWVRKPHVQLLPQDEAQTRILFLRPYLSNMEHDHRLVLEGTQPSSRSGHNLSLDAVPEEHSGRNLQHFIMALPRKAKSTEIHLPVWLYPLMSDMCWSSIPSHHQLQEQMGFRDPYTWEICSQAFPCVLPSQGQHRHSLASSMHLP